MIQAKQTRWLRIVIGWALAWGSASAAAPLPMYFDRYDRDAGLSQLAVHTIAQDATGFMWLGTEDGLDRFDGYTFTHSARHTEAPGSLPNGFVADVQPDASGALWIATDGGGVARQDPATGRFEPLPVPDSAAARAGLERVRCLIFDHAGQLWIGTRDEGLARFDPSSRRIERLRHASGDAASRASDSIFALLEDRQHTMWIGTAAGLDRIEAGASGPRRQPLPVPQPTTVHALLEDRSGALWAGTAAGLVRLDRATRATRLFRHDASDATSLPADGVNALLEDRAGRLWIGTVSGLALFDTARGTFAVYKHDPADPRSLPDDHIVSLHEDRGGLIWVGTKFGGLAKWNPRTWLLGHQPASTEQGFASSTIMAFTEDADERLWIATFGGGIAVVNGSTQRVTLLRQGAPVSHGAAGSGGLSDDRVMALLTDHEGHIWAGTMSGGLVRIVPATGAMTVFRHNDADPHSLGASGVMSLFEDSAGRLWVGTYGGGLSLLDRATGTFHRYTADTGDRTKLASGRVTALAESPRGYLWVGTDGGGLSVMNTASGTFTTFRHDARDPGSIAADTVYALHVDPRGGLWIGTRGGGLDRALGREGAAGRVRFAHLTEKNGLPNSTVYGIESDASGQLWVSSNYGIARIDPAKGVVRAYHRAHGLQGEEFNFGAHYASASGRLFFGGGTGYNAFLPADLQSSGTAPPPIALTSYSFPNRAAIDGAAARELHRLHLGYDDGLVTFEFAALDYTAPQSNTFQYRLEGVEGAWVNAGTRRSVTYANLPGGDYTLRVRAANADGAWNNAGIAIGMHVDPPPWKSNWAYATYALAIALLFLFSWRAHRNALKREALYSRKLEQQVLERTRELAAHANALQNANLKLQEASFTDPLTGLGNRRSLEDRARHAIASLPPGGRLAVMVVDLDCLKPINDDFGHEAGDRVLTEISRILRDSLRSVDTVVRWGGDEFVVVHQCESLDDAAALAERIRGVVATHRFAIGEQRSTRSSCSIGFALYPFVHSAPNLVSWTDVLKLADAALYRAKHQRNSWVGWSGAKPVHDIATRVAADPEGAESERLIDVRKSDAACGETIRLLLLRARGAQN